MKPLAIDWIDDWNDLFRWKHLKIQMFKTSGLDNFINDFPYNPMAIDFKEIFDLLNDNDFQSGNKSYDKDLDYEGVKEGRTAIVGDLHYLNIYKKNLESSEFQENIDYHISSSGELSQPVFTISNRVRLSETMATTLDQV